MGFIKELVVLAFQDDYPRPDHQEAFYIVLDPNEKTSVDIIAERLASYYPNLERKHVKDVYSITMPGDVIILRFVIDNIAYDVDHPPSQLLDMLLRNNLQVDTAHRQIVQI